MFYPGDIAESDEKYPVIVWANGTGCITQLYFNLLKSIAAAGYIVAADTSVMTADGTAQVILLITFSKRTAILQVIFTARWIQRTLQLRDIHRAEEAL